MMKKCIRSVSRFIRPLAYLVGWFMPIDNNKIVVSSFSGKGYGDNPKYIVEELIKTNESLRIIWILRDIEDKKSLPVGVEYCLEKSFMSTFHLRTAKIWIDNCRKSFRYKRANQFYLQTWHGFALKRIEKDVQEKLSKGYIKGALIDSNHIDLIISCSKFMTNLYTKSFWYDGEVLELGAPRNDILLKNSDEVKSKVFEYFDISCEKGIVLYAPTFRADKSLLPYTIDYGMLEEVCENKFKKECVILVRMHPAMSDMNIDGLSFDGKKIINANLYPDIQELLCAADVVISDYSSLMFDFALSKKPCFIFATDIENYKKDRNFYFDLSRLPFPIAETNEKLKENILGFDNSVYAKSLEDFFNMVGMVRDGQSSKKIAKLISEVLKSNND